MTVARPPALPVTSSSPWFDGFSGTEYPALRGQHDVDVTVVGAGITGLSTALMLKRQGYRVAVLEARRVGAVTSGHTTAKISLLQGTRAASLESRLGRWAVGVHLAAHAAGQE